MRLTLVPTLDELMYQLSNEGWSIGDVAINHHWQANGTKCSFIIQAIGVTRIQAWEAAVEQARLLDEVLVTRN